MGKIRSGDLRQVVIGALGSSLTDQLISQAARTAHGDTVNVITMRVDEHGEPLGNREERRRARKMLRQGGK